MTDTPRTDALADRMASEPELEALARTLERELAAARALSEIYFNIARDFYSEEEIRRRRDAAIDAARKGHD